ncbi:hypothetical protein [Georgenia yuyongxinii]|uniref:hypothetical protein n=1 Tax=Georgenia yuyongxinii TaxID=2589797 RepID=UPI00163D6350|nr:hypothetical protein [Georgenia yuyongxinii]
MTGTRPSELSGLALLVQHLGCIAAACVGKATQLGRVATLASKLDQLIHRIAAACVGKATQLGRVATLASKLDQLIDCVSVSTRCKGPQLV